MNQNSCFINESKQRKTKKESTSNKEIKQQAPKKEKKEVIKEKK